MCFQCLLLPVGVFERYRGVVVDARVEPDRVVPIDPEEGRELECFDGVPGSFVVDALCFVEADDALGEGVVVAVADAADRGQRAGLNEFLGVANREILGDPASEWWTSPVTS